MEVFVSEVTNKILDPFQTAQSDQGRADQSFVLLFPSLQLSSSLKRRLCVVCGHKCALKTCLKQTTQALAWKGLSRS